MNLEAPIIRGSAAIAWFVSIIVAFAADGAAKGAAFVIALGLTLVLVLGRDAKKQGQ